MSIMDWNGQSAIVTGGASGLGAATAERLAADGLKVTHMEKSSGLMARSAWRHVKATDMTSDCWSNEFDIETRDDGAIIIAQKVPLPDHLPTLADYLDKWAGAAPDHPKGARHRPASGGPQ